MSGGISGAALGKRGERIDAVMERAAPLSGDFIMHRTDCPRMQQSGVMLTCKCKGPEVLGTVKGLLAVATSDWCLPNRRKEIPLEAAKLLEVKPC